MNIRYESTRTITEAEFVDLLRRSTLAERRPIDDAVHLCGHGLKLRGATESSELGLDFEDASAHRLIAGTEEAKALINPELGVKVMGVGPGDVTFHSNHEVMIQRAGVGIGLHHPFSSVQPERSHCAFRGIERALLVLFAPRASRMGATSAPRARRGSWSSPLFRRALR